MNEIKILAGLDIGNGCVKGKVSIDGGEPHLMEFESTVAIETNSLDIKSKGDYIKMDIDDIFNNMEASFDSPAIKSHTNRLFGKRGTHSGKATEEFDVASTISKADQDLSAILIFGALAGEALKHWFYTQGALPVETLKVKAQIAVALPITEYKMYRKRYAEKLQGVLHMVSIHNFEMPVRVEIEVVNMNVLAEGAAAQFAIMHKDASMFDGLFAELKSVFGQEFEGITGADVLTASNTIGIDIGDGTVNFPVFQNGKFNPDVSMTFGKGYGTVMEQAGERLRMMGMPIQSRKTLTDLLEGSSNRLKAARQNKILQVLEEEAEGFAQEVIVQFRKVMSRIGAYTEVIFVYGGGAIKVKNWLYGALVDAAKQFGGDDASYPVFYIAGDESRYLNAEGLFDIATQVAV